MTKNALRSLICFLALSVFTAVGRSASVELVAGGGESQLGGSAKGAKLIEPFGVAFDNNGNWYIVEYHGHRVTRVSPDGKISLFAGTGEKSFSGDGGPALQATFNEPHRLVISKDQQMYIADTRNHRIRQVDLKTKRIVTIAGTGEAGYGGELSGAGLAGREAIIEPSENRPCHCSVQCPVERADDHLTKAGRGIVAGIHRSHGIQETLPVAIPQKVAQARKEHPPDSPK